MGTNYYLHTTDKPFVEEFFPGEYELCDYPFFSYCVHLNKCSGGWRTLYQAHEKAYSSVKELEAFLAANAEKYELFDEYGEKLSLDDYRERVIGRDAELLKKDRLPYCWKESSLFPGTMDLELCEDGEEPAIWSPFDHEEYERAEIEFYGRRPIVSGGFFADKDGNNFSRHEFS